MPTGIYPRTEKHKHCLFQKGHIVPQEWKDRLKIVNTGLKHSEESKNKRRIKMKDRHPWNMGLKGYRIHSEETKKKIGLSKSGDKHWNWKGGISKDIKAYKIIMRKHNTDRERERNHRLGIHKRYIEKYGGPKAIPENLLKKKYKYERKNAGPLSVKTIQLVYEDNIKKYGTLTCYLCLKPIEFKKDCLEHKIPISRGGTNEYGNLEVAHQICNSKKNNKTEEEYRKAMQGYEWKPV